MLVAEKRPSSSEKRKKLRLPLRLPPRWERFVLVSLVLVLLGVIGVGGGGGYVLWKYGRNLPEYEVLAHYEPPITTRIHAGDGALLAEYATEKRVFVPTAQIPKVVLAAFLSAEDKNFYGHFGVDMKALLRAVLTNAINYGSNKRPVGASTITQQVAKNFLLSNELSIERKIKEAILAIRMERIFTKDELLALYLNEIYLGLGSYGVAAAALNYFDKPLADLSLSEAAYLAALPKAPNNYHPERNREAAIGRRNWVLGQMERNDHITRAEATSAKKEPIILKERSGVDGADAPYFSEEVRRLLVKRFGSDEVYRGGYSVRTTLDPKLQLFADNALIQGLESLDKRQGWRGALGSYNGDSAHLLEILAPYARYMHEDRFPAVVTGVWAKQADIVVRLDDETLAEGQIPFALADWAYPPRRADGRRPRPIRDLNEALKKGDIIMVQRPHTAPDRVQRHEDQDFSADNIWALGQLPLVEGAIVALDPHSGRVLAMSGGYNYARSEFNRATQAYRQAGSAFKPFVYLAALDKGFSPITRIIDAPIVLDQGPGLPKWRPSNYSRKFYGPSIMRLGIEKSSNLMTIRLAMTIGMPAVQEYAKRFGINENMPSLLSMALGAGETTLMQLTTAYGIIVNGGSQITPSIIDRIQDRYGKTIFRHDSRPCHNCNIATLKDNGADLATPPPLPNTRKRITEKASAYQMVTMLQGVVERGTASELETNQFDVAGKTGTTNANTNAWFIGFTPDLVVGIYVGFDTLRPLGLRETGTSAAVPIFSDFINKAMADRSAIPFRRPSDVNLFAINPETGESVSADTKGSIIEAFKPGQRPLEAGKANNITVIDIPSNYAPQAAQPLPELY